MATCGTCEGSGRVPGCRRVLVCLECRGTGEVELEGEDLAVDELVVMVWGRGQALAGQAFHGDATIYGTDEVVAYRGCAMELVALARQMRKECDAGGAFDRWRRDAADSVEAAAWSAVDSAVATGHELAGYAGMKKPARNGTPSANRKRRKAI